ncbi:MAG: AIR synthase-related protein [Candidatus Marinimicrobia bacterium]|nr:AIR synthase-related protein [Candidatus Neomarinimicrobiota bacterium]
MAKEEKINLSEYEFKEISILKEGELTIPEEKFLIAFKQNINKYTKLYKHKNNHKILRELKTSKSVNVGDNYYLISEFDNEEKCNKDIIAKRVVAKGGDPIITILDKSNKNIVTVGIKGKINKKEKVNIGDSLFIVENSLDKINSDTKRKNKYKTIELLKKIWIINLTTISEKGLLNELIKFNKRYNVGIDVLSKKVYDKLKLEGINELLFSSLSEKTIVIIKKEFKKEAKEFFKTNKIENFQLGKIITDTKLNLHNGDQQLKIPFQCFDVISTENHRHKYSDNEWLSEHKNTDIDIETIPEPEDLLKIIKEMVAKRIIQKNYQILATYDNELLFTTNDSLGIRHRNLNKSIVITVGDYATSGVDQNLIAVNIVDSIQKNMATGSEIKAINYFLEDETEQTIHQIAEVCSYFDISTLNCKMDDMVDDKKSTISNITYGLLDDKVNPITPYFKNDGDFICIVGNLNGEIKGSAYLSIMKKNSETILQKPNFEVVRNINHVIHESIKIGIIKSAIKISKGGLIFSLINIIKDSAEDIGANIFFDRKIRDDFFLLGESQSVILVSLDEQNLIELIKIAQKNNVNCSTIGRVKSGRKININNKIEIEVDKL